MPIFRVKSVKIYTGQKNLHEHVRGVRDKYRVWVNHPVLEINLGPTTAEGQTRKNHVNSDLWDLFCPLSLWSPYHSSRCNQFLGPFYHFTIAYWFLKRKRPGTCKEFQERPLRGLLRRESLASRDVQSPRCKPFFKNMSPLWDVM